jgi:hypothetical protein
MDTAEAYEECEISDLDIFFDSNLSSAYIIEAMGSMDSMNTTAAKKNLDMFDSNSIDICSMDSMDSMKNLDTSNSIGSIEMGSMNNLDISKGPPKDPSISKQLFFDSNLFLSGSIILKPI